MHGASPPGSVYALGPGGLRRDDVTVWSAWFVDGAAFGAYEKSAFSRFLHLELQNPPKH